MICEELSRPLICFIVADEVIEVNVTLDNKATIVYERTNKGNEVVLKKSDIITGKPVAGATIEIYDSEGRAYGILGYS